MFKKLIVFITVIILLFVLHVPALKLLTNPSKAQLAEYPLLTDGTNSENFEITRVYIGNIYDVVYAPDTKHYLISGARTDTLTEKRYGYYVVTLDEFGQLISEKEVKQDELQEMFANPRYQNMPKTLERKYIPEYDFADVAEHVKLAKYSFEQFEQWPRFVYFFPAVFSDWKGTAFLDIHHQGEVLKARIATDFFGGIIYTGNSIDGQIYPRIRAGSDVAFLEVNESSFGHSPDGKPDIHRVGLGLYVIRPAN